MPRLVLNNAYVLFASNDISEFVTQIELKTSVDTIDTTQIGAQSRTRQAGVFDNSVTFQFNQDYADNALSIHFIVANAQGVEVAEAASFHAQADLMSFTMALAALTMMATSLAMVTSL